MITHILSNSPEEYQKIVGILEDKLNEKDHPITIERIHDKLLVKFDRRNRRLETKSSREDEKSLYVFALVLGRYGLPHLKLNGTE